MPGKRSASSVRWTGRNARDSRYPLSSPERIFTVTISAINHQSMSLTSSYRITPVAIAIADLAGAYTSTSRQDAPREWKVAVQQTLRELPHPDCAGRPGPTCRGTHGASHRTGTDAQMAENSVNYQGFSGILRNQYVNVSVGDILIDRRAPVSALLTRYPGVIATPEPDKWFLQRWVSGPTICRPVIATIKSRLPSSMVITIRTPPRIRSHRSNRINPGR